MSIPEHMVPIRFETIGMEADGFVPVAFRSAEREPRTGTALVTVQRWAEIGPMAREHPGMLFTVPKVSPRVWFDE